MNTNEQAPKQSAEEIKKAYGHDYNFFEPYIDFTTGIANVPSKISRKNISRERYKIWIGIEAPSDCQFYECFKPLCLQSIKKDVETLLCELQDELHYKAYPSEDKKPIHKTEHLDGDYFPLHMVKTVSERYANNLQQRISDLEATVKMQRDALVKTLKITKSFSLGGTFKAVIEEAEQALK